MISSIIVQLQEVPQQCHTLGPLSVMAFFMHCTRIICNNKLKLNLQVVFVKKPRVGPTIQMLFEVEEKQATQAHHLTR